MTEFQEFYLNAIAWLFIGSVCLTILTHILETFND
jgi:hypothetical protein